MEKFIPGSITYPAPTDTDNLRLYEVRLPDLVVVRVVTTSHLRALQLAIAHTPIKPTDAVTVIPMGNLIVDSRL